MKRNVWRDLGLIGLLSVGLLTTYLLSGNHVPIDPKWSLYTAMSIWREGNANLDEYRPLIAEVHEPHPLEMIDGHIYSIYPLGAPLMALPFVVVLDTATGGQLSRSMQHTIPGEAEMLVASFLVAVTGVLLYAIARLFLGRRESLLLALIFGLGTSAWSVASRALWQHGPSMLWLTATLYLLLLAQRRPAFVQLAGIPLMMAYVSRPTNSISVLLLSIYVFVHVLDAGGNLVAQNDRLDVPSEDWRAGDMIEQVNQVDLTQVSTTESGYQIEVGLYNLATGERLPVIVNGHAVDSRLVLTGETPR